MCIFIINNNYIDSSLCIITMNDDAMCFFVGVLYCCCVKKKREEERTTAAVWMQNGFVGLDITSTDSEGQVYDSVHLTFIASERLQEDSK